MINEDYAIYNPKNKNIKDLPIIYGFNNGGSKDMWHALLISQGGTFLGGHLCSHEEYMPHDLGVLKGSRSDRHETFKKHYPEGYRMEFIKYDDVKDTPGLMRAFELNKQIEKQD